MTHDNGAPDKCECHCFERQTWCDCAAGKAREARRRELSRGPNDVYLAFLRGEIE